MHVFATASLRNIKNTEKALETIIYSEKVSIIIIITSIGKKRKKYKSNFCKKMCEKEVEMRLEM